MFTKTRWLAALAVLAAASVQADPEHARPTQALSLPEQQEAPVPIAGEAATADSRYQTPWDALQASRSDARPAERKRPDCEGN